MSPIRKSQGGKRNPNPNFLIRIFSGGVGVFHMKGWGPKSSVCASKPRETKCFGGPGFCRDIPGAPEKFEKKKFVFNSRPLKRRGSEKSIFLAIFSFFFLFSDARFVQEFQYGTICYPPPANPTVVAMRLVRTTLKGWYIGDLGVQQFAVVPFAHVQTSFCKVCSSWPRKPLAAALVNPYCALS